VILSLWTKLRKPNRNIRLRCPLPEPSGRLAGIWTQRRIAYGDRLTEGKGETLRPLNDTTEAAMAVTPFIGPAGKAAAATGKAAVRELGPKVSMMAEGYLQRQGLAPSASAKIRFHMSHTNSYHPGLTIRRILTPCTSITTISR